MKSLSERSPVVNASQPGRLCPDVPDLPLSTAFLERTRTQVDQPVPPTYDSGQAMGFAFKRCWVCPA